MATFKYTAFDENEKNLKGFINATDSDEARLIPVSYTHLTLPTIAGV